MMGLGAAVVAAPAALAQTPAALPDPAVAISAKAAEARLKLDFDGQRFSGPAYDLLLNEARQAQFFMIGEEHGIAENPKLAGQLFEAAAYRRMGIEVSHPIALDLDGAARGGVAGMKRLFQTPGATPAFFGMREEAEMLARIRAAVPGAEPVLWGLDYEVGADRRLVTLLEAAKKPPAAEAALARLKAAQIAAWAKAQSGGIQDAFSFAGDPALVGAVRAAWPRPDARSLWALDALEETLQINGLWNARKGWESNLRRSQFIRANFLRHWQAEGGKGRAMFKLGANHLIRGLNDVGMFDLGSLLPEVAALTGAHAFSIMVLPGTTSDVAVLDPQTWSYKPASAKDDYANGLEILGNLAYPDAFTLFDLRVVRQVIGRRSTAAYPQVAKLANGFDALLVMSGSKPSANL